MPKRADLKSVLVIGSGPIVIGQACEFDYSGTQACRVLRQEGIRVSLVNSNPATIMTDPEFADATYVEPITLDVLEKVIAKERPDAVLPTLGGQTALNAAVALHEAGTLARYGVELIGADIEAIRAGEDRSRFKEIVTELGAEVPRQPHLPLPRRVRAGSGRTRLPAGGPARRSPWAAWGPASPATPVTCAGSPGPGLDASPVTEVLLEESILGWKEFELELMRDRNDNAVIVCSIENIDPMGVHTGDSVTVAPAMTLTDREYQHMRDIAIATARAVGVDTGGCNIQFAVHPSTGRMVVIEMNPRVSRSSALASKATGFPIAKIAARLAIGYTLDEIRNDITGETPASFEPALDYVVVKVPRFAFEKFPGADPVLTTHMKSVGEAMAIGRSFPEALQKALRSLEHPGAPLQLARSRPVTPAELLRRCASPHDGRLATVHQAIRAGATVAELAEATGIDPWFIDQIKGIEEHAERVAVAGPAAAEPRTSCGRPRRPGSPTRRSRRSAGRPKTQVRGLRHAAGRAAGVPHRGHVRGRVRRAHAVPVLDLRRADRGAGRRPPQGDHPRQRAEPHRPGHRVRLRLRARLVRAVRGRLRDRDGQLQPGDRVHRLRHLRPAVLRAAHAGGRARGGGRRAGQRAGRRGDRPARRADAARPGPGAGRGGRPGGRHLAGRHPPGRGPGRVRRGAGGGRPARAAVRHGHVPGRGAAGRRRDRLPGAGPAVLRARRPRDGDRLRRRHAGRLRRPGHRGQPRAPGADRQVPRRRDRDRRRRPLRRRGTVPGRRDGAHRGGGHPLRRLGLRAAADHAGPREHRRDPAVAPRRSPGEWACAAC